MESYYGIYARSAQDAFSCAAANTMLDVMQQMLEDGAVDINGLSGDGKTALHSAAHLGLTRSLKWLIEHGADLNARGEHDQTPLMAACTCGKKKGSRVAMM